MHYDQSWMGFGFIGGLEAGIISAIVGTLLFGVFHWLGQRNGWSYGPQVSWAFLLTTLLTAGGDLSDLFYFNYAQTQSLQLLRAELAQVHDPDGIGTRVAFELFGAVLGICLGWALCNCAWGRRLFRSGK
ncbi:MAG: hypothetical protein WAM90_07420 [Rhodanobacter sp.]